MKKILYYEIEGLFEETFSNAVKETVLKVEGVNEVSFNLPSNKIKLLIDERFNEKVFFKVMTLSGFNVEKVFLNTSKKKFKSISLPTQLAILIILLILLLYLIINELFKLPFISFFDSTINPINYAITQMLIVVLMMVVGYKYYLDGFKNLIKFKLNIETFVALSTSIGFLYSLYITILILIGNKEYTNKLYFINIGMILFFVTLGKCIEKKQPKNTFNELKKTTDIIIGYCIPLVLFIALIGFIFWIIFTKDFNISLNVFVSVLVISCPCALNFTSSISLITIKKTADKYDISIFNGKALEVASKCDLVVFEKTGIITKGKLSLKEIITTSNYLEYELLQIALSLELNSDNLFKEAIKTYAQNLNIKEREVVNFKYYPNLGLKGEINKKVYFIGNEKWITTNNIKVAQERNIVKKGKGKTYLYIGSDVLLGLISFTDELREETKEVIKKLHDLNIKTVLLSSDNEATVSYIASDVGIDKYYGSLLKEDKENIIKKLKENHTVLIVSNSKLSETDVLISIGSGANVNSDVLISNNNLKALLTLISLSEKTHKNIKENFFLVFFYHLIGIILALGALFSFNILLTPILSLLLMIFSNIVVILNSLKLKFFKQKNYGI
ncbi:MAG: HAD-IC family P-type ATPase [Acholeplasmataceae bacterium]|nr:HAD-IC family P-type ATPase [Acholeplasmataceae bacterium]